MRKKILATVLGVTICLGSMTGCAGFKREIVDMKSDWNGGMNRVITVYTADGKKIAEYKGKIDIDTNLTTKVRDIFITTASQKVSQKLIREEKTNEFRRNYQMRK